jgi:GTPase SAR1 family protein
MERFDRLHHGYYRNTHCICIVYDVTNAKSFEEVLVWLEEAAEYAPNAARFLIGNKCDLENFGKGCFSQ